MSTHIDRNDVLVPFGWAPGGYMNICGKCGVTHQNSDKRSPYCLRCALVVRDGERDVMLRKLAVMLAGAGLQIEKMVEESSTWVAPTIVDDIDALLESPEWKALKL
jgi:hypothetical protein